jgi:hypothetical protein
MAGHALDPNGSGGPDVALARLLLAHALISIAQAVENGEPVRSEAGAIAALEQSGLLARAAGRRNGGRSVLECLEREPAEDRDPEPLVKAELLLGKVVRVVQGEPAVSRVRRWSRWGVALLFVAAVAAVIAPGVDCGGPWDKYRWTASSSTFGFAKSGVLGGHGDYGLVFHTDLESRPSVTIDLLQSRTIHSVKVTNRTDCCDERCLPLFVEVAGDDKHFVEVGHRTETFAAWRADFTPRRARYVKLWVDAKTYFHLSGVEIR